MINVMRILKSEHRQEFVVRLIMAELIAKRGQGPLARPEFAGVQASVETTTPRTKHERR